MVELPRVSFSRVNDWFPVFLATLKYLRRLSEDHYRVWGTQHLSPAVLWVVTEAKKIGVLNSYTARQFPLFIVSDRGQFWSIKNWPKFKPCLLPHEKSQTNTFSQSLRVPSSDQRPGYGVRLLLSPEPWKGDDSALPGERPSFSGKKLGIEEIVTFPC